MLRIFYFAIVTIVIGIGLWLFNLNPKTAYEKAYGKWTSQNDAGVVMLQLNKDYSYTLQSVDKGKTDTITIKGTYHIAGAYTQKEKTNDTRLQLINDSGFIKADYRIAKINKHEFVLEVDYNKPAFLFTR